MPNARQEPLNLTTAQALYALDMSHPTLMSMTRTYPDPLPIERKGQGRGKHTLFDLRAVVRWSNRRAFAEAGVDATVAPVLNLDAERARLAKAQADAHEMKNATSRGDLVPVENVERVIAGAGQDVRALLVALPLDIKRREPALTSGAIAAINECVGRCLNAIAEVSIDDEDEPDGGERAAA